MPRTIAKSRKMTKARTGIRTKSRKKAIVAVGTNFGKRYNLACLGDCRPRMIYYAI